MKPSLRSALLLLLGVACAPASSAAQVVPSNPPATPVVEGQIPALPAATGVLLDAPADVTDKNTVHEGRFTWGPDLFNPGTASRPVWNGWHFPVGSNPLDPLRFTLSPAFQTHVGSALTAADQQCNELDAGTIGSVFSFFESLLDLYPGAKASVQTPPGGTPLKPFFGYRPVRSRWLRSQWSPIGPGPGEKLYQYEDYAAFQDVRLRGARLYCAARHAQFQQNGQHLSLGERPGFSVSILGRTIDFMVVEPTVSLNGPSKFFSEGDGAQAFTVPLLLGTVVTPIRGFLPPLKEARVPVVFVTGDTEVRTAAEKRGVLLVQPGLGRQKAALIVNQPSKEYHTVTHADAVLSAGFYDDSHRFELDAEILLFTLGPLQVYGLLGMQYDVGAFEANTSGTPDDRVLSGFPGGWPPLTRTGRLYTNPLSGIRYHDGPWEFGIRPFHWRVLPDGQTDPFWTAPITAVLQPHDIRALTDDDHVVSSATSAGLELGLRGALGAEVSPFHVEFTAEGKFTGTVTSRSVLRDALVAQDPLLLTTPFTPRMRPMTALSVRPRQTADITFSGLLAKLFFELDLFFGKIAFTKELLNTPKVTIAAYDSDDHTTEADERHILRIATGASIGTPMTQPIVYSHLPGRGEFETFVEDVPACLADPATPPPPPAPCEPEPVVSRPPGTQLCIVGPDLPLVRNGTVPALPTGVCSNIPGWVAAQAMTAGQKACMVKYLGFLCAPVSNDEQTWGGGQVGFVSRVWNLETSMNDALLPILDECADAFVISQNPGDPKLQEKVEAFVAGLVGVAACDVRAILVEDSEIIKAVNPTTPPEIGAGVCK